MRKIWSATSIRGEEHIYPLFYGNYLPPQWPFFWKFCIIDSSVHFLLPISIEIRIRNLLKNKKKTVRLFHRNIMKIRIYALVCCYMYSIVFMHSVVHIYHIDRSHQMYCNLVLHDAFSAYATRNLQSVISSVSGLVSQCVELFFSPSSPQFYEIQSIEGLSIIINL